MIDEIARFSSMSDASNRLERIRGIAFDVMRVVFYSVMSLTSVIACVEYFNELILKPRGLY